ncbi:peptidase A4 family-domain-containing protein [Boletus edulis BED1]|uniref:Peptidase A4 family-domain-containing protein n=1 Tax=Boletus edulis BED1 TaxID=1328754 RepID=A0AAD4GBS1_BOLED|nr:peptidase A4 family-domain-containing protein [Boletus edulis BED1]
MRFISVLIPSFFLISSVLAGRREHLSLSHDLAKKPTNAAPNRLADSNNTPNWAGAIWNQPNGTFWLVTGTFIVPDITGQMVNSTAYASVGIDGGTCADIMLHAGVRLTVNSTGPSYDAWYMWGNEFANLFDPSVDISPGDTIRLTVGTPGGNETSGYAMIQNLSTEKDSIRNFDSQRALCGQNAMWIAARLSGAPLANFGTVTFTEATAEAHNGQTYPPQGATITEIVGPGDQPLTSVSVDGDEVSIRHL